MIDVYIPFTRLRSKTVLALMGHTDELCVHLVPVTGRYGYAEYFAERWAAGRTFINIEHDIRASWEIVRELWNCSQDMCLTQTILTPEGHKHHWHLGCVKISEKFIREHPIDWSGKNYYNCDGTIWTAYGGDQLPVCIHGEVEHLRFTEKSIE